MKENDVINCVITVPANFSFKQRQETMKAAELSGLHVLKLLNEPTAAAIAYSTNSDSCELSNKTIFIFDFGGGTLDCTIMRVNIINGKQQYQVLSTYGNTHLGGVDIDNSLCDYVINKLKEEYSDEYEELFGDKVKPEKRNNYMNRLKRVVEQAKIDFNNNNGELSISIGDIDNNFNDVDIDIEEEAWSKTLNNLSKRYIQTVQECIKSQY